MFICIIFTSSIYLSTDTCSNITRAFSVHIIFPILQMRPQEKHIYGHIVSSWQKCNSNRAFLVYNSATLAPNYNIKFVKMAWKWKTYHCFAPFPNFSELLVLLQICEIQFSLHLQAVTAQTHLTATGLDANCCLNTTKEVIYVFFTETFLHIKNYWKISYIKDLSYLK